MDREIKELLERQPTACDCEMCGTPLTRKTKVDTFLDIHIKVELCERCLQVREQAEYQKGYDDGYSVGFEAGKESANE